MTPKIVMKVTMNLDSSKMSDPYCISVAVLKNCQPELSYMMMMMMMNCFFGMVDQQKVLSLISSQDHCQGSSPSQISDTPQVRFEPMQNLSSGFLQWPFF